MAYRRATGILKLAHRRGVSSVLNSHTIFNNVQSIVSATLSFDELDLIAAEAASPSQQQHFYKLLGKQQRCFSSQSPQHHATSFRFERSNSSSSSSSEVSEVKPNTRDEPEESDVRIWKDSGDNDFADAAADSIREGTTAVVDSGSTDSFSVGEDVASGSIWSILRAPADGVVILVDGLHNLTGISWWLTIIGSTLAFRTALFPFTVTYMKKAAQFASSLSLLPPIRPPKDSQRSLAEQYRIFTKRRLELGVPSPFWGAAGLLQAPLFLYWIIALRGMAMSHHPGFESGGALWFVDLTVPVHGALGALFPSMVALTHFMNVQVSFRTIKPRNDLTGLLIKMYQWWLEAVTVPLFIIGFYLPQGVFMYWLTNNCFSLAQTIALQNDGFRGTVGLPLLSELNKLRSKPVSEPVQTGSSDLEILDMDTLLRSATRHATEDRDEEASKLLELGFYQLIFKLEFHLEVKSRNGFYVLGKRFMLCVADMSIQAALVTEVYWAVLLGMSLSNTLIRKLIWSRFLVKKYPEDAEAYNVYGWLHIKKKQWPRAIEYYNLAISKAKDDPQRITAFMGAGISLYNQGQRQEAISVMRPLVDIEVPQEPVTRQKYLRALITLGSALSQEGLKEEALSVLEVAVKWDRSIEVYIKQLHHDLGINES